MINELIYIFEKFGSKSHKEGYYNFWSEDIGITIHSKKYDKLNMEYPKINILPYYHYEIYLQDGYNKIKVKDEDCEYNCIEDMKIHEIDRVIVYQEKRICLYNTNGNDTMNYIQIREAGHSYGALYSYEGNLEDLEKELEDSYPEEDIWELPNEIIEKYSMIELTHYLHYIDPSDC